MMVLEYETRRRNNAIRQLYWDDIDQEDWVVTWRGEADKVGKMLVVPLTERAIDVLKGLPSRAIGHVPVFPSPKDPNVPVCSVTCQTYMTRAKKYWLRATPEAERAELKKRLRGVGFHAELRAGVRAPGFRGLPLKVQETVSGKSFDMLTRIYDEVTVEDMRDEGDAIGIPKTG